MVKHAPAALIAAAAATAALTACSSSAHSSSAHSSFAHSSSAHSSSVHGRPAGGTSTSAGTGAAAAPDPCGLVTADQIAMLTHTTVVSHVEADADVRRCTWTLHSTEVGTIGNPTVEIDDVTNKDLGPIDTYGDFSRGYTPVAGIGDKASSGRGNSTAVELVVLKHGIVVTVTAQLRGDSTDAAANESIARFAVVGL